MTPRGSEPIAVSTGFFEFIGRLRRWSRMSLRPSQADEIQRDIDRVVRWQSHLHAQICEALGVSHSEYSWEALISRIGVEHQRAESTEELTEP